MLSISIVEGDVRDWPADLLILKYADAFHGADFSVARRIEFAGSGPKKGDYTCVHGKNIKARQVLFVGVGRLDHFRYAEIKKFGRDALILASKLDQKLRKVAMPIHGPGYGLDESEAFLSLVAGIMDTVNLGALPRSLESIEFVEDDVKRVLRLRKLLATVLEAQPAQVLARGTLTVTAKTVDNEGGIAKTGPFLNIEKATINLANYGEPSDRKVRLFVAMPFNEQYTDEYDIAITEAAQHANIVCERIDKEAYVGDIMSQVKSRIGSYNGMLALLNDANPNVFLEIGYAWAKDKPTVLMVKKGQTLPFDITGQKCIVYSNITDLRNRLKIELKALIENGTLAGRANG
jgi:nucleoside 2-deoxyribosyltransferase